MSKRTRTRRTRKNRPTRKHSQKGGAPWTVRYGDTVVQGQTLTETETQQPPVATIPPGHFLAMYDPDAVNPSYLHWVTTPEHTYMPYTPPTPPPGTGVHRYIVVLGKGVPPIATQRAGIDPAPYEARRVASTYFTVKAP